MFNNRRTYCPITDRVGTGSHIGVIIRRVGTSRPRPDTLSTNTYPTWTGRLATVRQIALLIHFRASSFLLMRLTPFGTESALTRHRRRQGRSSSKEDCQDSK